MTDFNISENELMVLINRHKERSGGLIALLEDVQELYGYLPEPALRRVAEVTGRSLVDIYGVVTFYRCFSLQPRGRHHLCVCLGTACHVRNAPMVVEELERRLGIKAGATSPDGEFTLETVSCLGACALGPIVVADGTYHSKVDTGKVKSILGSLQTEVEEPEAESVIAV